MVQIKKQVYYKQPEEHLLLNALWTFRNDFKAAVFSVPICLYVLFHLSIELLANAVVMQMDDNLQSSVSLQNSSHMLEFLKHIWKKKWRTVFCKQSKILKWSLDIKNDLKTLEFLFSLQVLPGNLLWIQTFCLWGKLENSSILLKANLGSCGRLSLLTIESCWLSPSDSLSLYVLYKMETVAIPWQLSGLMRWCLRQNQHKMMLSKFPINFIRIKIFLLSRTL